MRPLNELPLPEGPGPGHGLGVADDQVCLLVILGQSHGHRARVETLWLVWNMEIDIIICISNNRSNNIYLARQRIKFKQIHQKKLHQ